MMNWLRKCFNWCTNWYSNNKNNILTTLGDLDDILGRFSRNATRLMFIGFVLNIVSLHLFPEFPEKFPAIYGWFNGWLQLGEFAIRGGLGAIFSLFNGNFGEFFNKYSAEFHGLIEQFVDWLTIIAP